VSTYAMSFNVYIDLCEKQKSFQPRTARDHIWQPTCCVFCSGLKRRS